MTLTMLILGTLGVILSILGIMDIIKEFTCFCRPGVVPVAVFQREGAGAARSGLDLEISKFRLPFENKTPGLKAEHHITTIR
ncbi:hypothetical protein [Paremcibacter congregatus]|uniref:Uncharacterized protein n=1 Tax=Paremcibacter congregatus TaxID=2043170 RepID=A0A2G4YT02_9PROT|nr:hypothetical protein [Paremcibacter congregatus]PHZ85468.1 hypothetical protein CRD36_06640 [Paremcibacter congregatus]QDE27293.1 hypothetical protein FIV45_08335 [Paremcibacter congregatus]